MYKAVLVAEDLQSSGGRRLTIIACWKRNEKVTAETTDVWVIQGKGSVVNRIGRTLQKYNGEMPKKRSMSDGWFK